MDTKMLSYETCIEDILDKHFVSLKVPWHNKILKIPEVPVATFTKTPSTQCLKISQNVTFELSFLAFSTNFWPIKTDLSGNTV